MPAPTRAENDAVGVPKQNAPFDLSQHNLAVQAPAAAKFGAYGPPGKGGAKYVAVLVCHGMGQQVQFETLDAVARGVELAAEQSGATTARDMTVSLHPSGGRFMGRAELRLSHSNGDAVEAHFFEAYWAPITEGKITLKQTLSFLRDAGSRGLKFAYQHGVFDRLMFGKREEFQIPAARVLHLALALWILVLIIAAFSALALVPVLKLVDLLRNVASSDFAFAAAVSYSIALSIVIAALLALPAAYLLRSRRAEPAPVVDKPFGFLSPSLWRRSAMVLAAATVVTIGAWLTYRAGLWMYRVWLAPLAADPSAHITGLVVAALTFGAEFVLLRMFTQRFLIQFVGDVAAYISPFKVSTFEEIRHDVQDRAKTVAKFIYQSGRSANEPRYDKVFFVGHSLGSVIAYDALNDSINRDTVPNGWEPGSQPGQLDVLARTRMLLTLGSPLDKIAFIFRTQVTNSEVQLRESLTTLLQPLVVDYGNRVARWINLWAPSDWISGRLTYYDSPTPPAGREVCNLRNKGAARPWVAHTRYWTDPLFSGVLYTALTGKPAATLSLSEQTNVMNAVGAVVTP